MDDGSYVLALCIPAAQRRQKKKKLMQKELAFEGSSSHQQLCSFKKPNWHPAMEATTPVQALQALAAGESCSRWWCLGLAQACRQSLSWAEQASGSGGGSSQAPRCSRELKQRDLYAFQKGARAFYKAEETKGRTVCQSSPDVSNQQ